MKIYHYDPETGEYLATTDARESPREMGVFLIPQYATATKPPAAQPEKAVAFRDGAWTYVEDHRGEQATNIVTGESFVISQIGELPDGSTLEPRPSPDHVWGNGEWVLDVERLGALVNAERDRRIAMGLTVETTSGKTVPIDTRSMQDLVNINGLVTASRIRHEIGQDAVIPFRGADNELYNLAHDDVIEIGLATADRIGNLYGASWAIKEQLQLNPAFDFASDAAWVLP